MAGALLFGTARARRQAFGMLLAGGASHLAVDALKQWAGGVNGAYLYPVTWWRNPTPGWYVSADRWVLGVVIVVFLVDRRAWIRGLIRFESCRGTRDRRAARRVSIGTPRTHAKRECGTHA